MRRLIIAAASLATFAPEAAHASITLNVTEISTGVTVTGSGSINTAGFAAYAGPSAGYSVVINSFTGEIMTGTIANFRLTTDYAVLTPSGAGLGSNNTYTYSNGGLGTSGDPFGVLTLYGELFLPTNYVSGSQLNGYAYYDGATFASLGLTTGTYAYNTINGETVTINVGDVFGVPEPATWAMMLLGFAGIGVAMRGRHKAVPELA